MEQFDREQIFPYENQPGRLILHSHSIQISRLCLFVEDEISAVCESLNGGPEELWVITRARAEVLLHSYNWNIDKLQLDYLTDNEKVLAAVHFVVDPESGKEPDLSTFFPWQTLKSPLLLLLLFLRHQ
jgi:hypothetical protein